MCFFRRRDLPSPLIVLADKHQSKQRSLSIINYFCNEKHAFNKT